MKASTLWVPLLVVAAVAGFAYVKVKTAKATGEQAYRVVVRSGEGGEFADVYNGTALEQSFGPTQYADDAAELAAKYLAEKGAPAFFVISESAGDGRLPRYFFDGWKNGEKVIEAEGPYGSEALANTAATSWAQKAGGQ